MIPAQAGTYTVPFKQNPSYMTSHTGYPGDKSSDSTSFPRCSHGDTALHMGSKSELDVFVELGLNQRQLRLLRSQSEKLPGGMKNCFANFLDYFFPQLNITERSEPKSREHF